MTLQALPLLWPLRYNQVGGHSHHTAFAPALPFSWNALCSCRSFPLPGMPFAPVDPSLFLECPLLVQIHHSLPYIFQVFDEMSLFRESFPDYPTSNCNPTPSLITLYPPPSTIAVIYSPTFLEDFGSLWFIYSFPIPTAVVHWLISKCMQMIPPISIAQWFST